jgi:hypothetical protein
MNGTESSFSKLSWKWVSRLSKLLWSVSELAVLAKWTFTFFLEVLAHLCLVLLFQGVELALCAVEVFIVASLLQVSHDLAWWVVEVSLFTIWA